MRQRFGGQLFEPEQDALTPARVEQQDGGSAFKGSPAVRRRRDTEGVPDRAQLRGGARQVLDATAQRGLSRKRATRRGLSPAGSALMMSTGTGPASSSSAPRICWAINTQVAPQLE